MTTAGLFDEPFDLPDVRCRLEDERFLAAAAIACGISARWDAAAEQLPRLFAEFHAAGVDDGQLYHLTAIIFERARVLRDVKERRNRMIMSMPFIDAERMNAELKGVHMPPRRGPLYFYNERR